MDFKNDKKLTQGFDCFTRKTPQMKLIKFLVYSFGLVIGCSIAFCANSNYDHNTYDPKYADSIENNIQIDKVKEESFSTKYKTGKALFRANCASCHNKNMLDDMTGPALRGTMERWEGREELLYKWIRNSQAVIASGDAYAVELYNKYNKSPMTSFPNFKDEEISALLEYIEKTN